MKYNRARATLAMLDGFLARHLAAPASLSRVPSCMYELQEMLADVTV